MQKIFLPTPTLYVGYRKDTGRAKNQRKISEKLAKYKHLITAPNTEKHTILTRLTSPTCLTRPTCPTCLTRPTCPTRLTRPTIAGAARTLTRPTSPTRLTRPIIAGAARTFSPHNPPSPPSLLILQFRTNINSKGF